MQAILKHAHLNAVALLSSETTSAVPRLSSFTLRSKTTEHPRNGGRATGPMRSDGKRNPLG
jgi:hypothetical protein